MRSKKTYLSKDGSIKHLIELDDGLCIEAVWIPQEDGINLCISCQVGCPNKCRHCATGNIFFERDMTCSEIFSEVKLLIENHGNNNGNIKVLYMGMGEPFLNYDNVLLSVRKMVEAKLLSTGTDAIVSTSGIVPGIIKLSKETTRPRLAVTIATVPDSKRVKLIPITKLFSLTDIISACRKFQIATKDKIIFEIPLIDSFNDTIEDAIGISNILEGLKCEIQVIPFNRFITSEYSPPLQHVMSAYINVLRERGMDVLLKPSYGVDISAGCGQLINVS